MSRPPGSVGPPRWRRGKLKIVAVVLLLIAVVGLGVGGLAYPTQAADPGAREEAKQREVRPEAIPFVRGHALYLKAIPGGKAKNDKGDAQKLAVSLRGGRLPRASVSPKGMREPRDLLRRRTSLVRRRAEARAPLVNTNSQYNPPPLAKKRAYAANRAERDLPAPFTDPSAKRDGAVALAPIGASDAQVGDRELYLTRAAKVDDAQAAARRRSIPGVGKALGRVVLSALHTLRRFPGEGQSLAYARLGRGAPASAGKKQGPAGNKIGNAPLKGAFSEAPWLRLRARARAKAGRARRAKKHGKKRARGALAARLGRPTTCAARAQPSTRAASSRVENQPSGVRAKASGLAPDARREAHVRRGPGGQQPNGGTPGASALRSP